MFEFNLTHKRRQGNNKSNFIFNHFIYKYKYPKAKRQIEIKKEEFSNSNSEIKVQKRD